VDPLEDQHFSRLRHLDPLLPSGIDLPSDGVRLDVPGGVGVARVVVADPATLDHTWNPAERHVLTARVGSEDPAGSLDALLSCWSPVRSAADSAASITWPSRDAVVVPTLLTHGLAPLSVLAIRVAGQESPRGAGGVDVRRATDADISALVAMELELVRWNQMLGQMTLRSNTASLVHAKYSASRRPWSWVALVDDVPAAFLTVLDPSTTPWASRLSSFDRVAYLSDLFVLPQFRGSLADTSLVRQVHAELDSAGFSAVLLHYLGVNAVSAPFWHRCGYRPLTTTWEVRPASHLR
jgi:hypothetical protein